MTDKLIRQAATEQAEAAETPPLLMVLVDLIKQNLWLLEFGSERPLDFVNPAVVAAREIGVLCLRCPPESTPRSPKCWHATRRRIGRHETSGLSLSSLSLSEDSHKENYDQPRHLLRPVVVVAKTENLDAI